MLCPGEKPTWTENNMGRDLLCLAGTTINLKCPAKGSPTPSIRWLKDNEPYEKRPLGQVRMNELIN